MPHPRHVEEGDKEVTETKREGMLFAFAGHSTIRVLKKSACSVLASAFSTIQVN